MLWEKLHNILVAARSHGKEVTVWAAVSAEPRLALEGDLFLVGRREGRRP